MLSRQQTMSTHEKKRRKRMMMILFMQIQNSLFLLFWIIYAKCAIGDKRKKMEKTGKNARKYSRLCTIDTIFCFEFFFFSRSCPACQRAIRISFVMFPICARRIKKKKKISFNHNHMMIMMSMNISHAKRKILFYQTY